MAPTYESCEDNIKDTVSQLHNLGFTVHPEKILPSTYSNLGIFGIHTKFYSHDSNFDRGKDFKGARSKSTTPEQGMLLYQGIGNGYRHFSGH